MQNRVQLYQKLFDVALGFSLINQSLCYSETDSDILLDILNGETKDNLTNASYQDCFEYSFDEEGYYFLSLVEEYGRVYELKNSKISSNKSVQNVTIFEGFLIGLLMSENSLTSIVEICDNNTDLQNELLSLDSKEITYNPFKEKGIREFVCLFTKFKNNYLDDVKKHVDNNVLAEHLDRIATFNFDSQQFIITL